MRAHTVTLDKPVAMGMLSVSVVSVVLKDTPAGLVLGTEHLIGTDVKVALNLNRTIKFGQAVLTISFGDMLGLKSMLAELLSSGIGWRLDGYCELAD